MSAPLIIGLTELEQQPWADVGAIVMAHALGGYGYRVVLLDADPCSAVLGPWGGTLPHNGPSLLGLLRSWMVGFTTVPATDEVLEILQDTELPGDIGFVRAADAPMQERPGAPTPRAVQAARDALRRAFVAQERAHVVIVRLPPLSTALGLSLAAQLVDVLVPLVPRAQLREVALALSQVSSLRGAELPVLPAEVNAAEDWSADDAEDEWLSLTRLVPIARVRPAYVVQSADDDRIGLPITVAEDFTALADAVREHTRLPHPDAQEQVWEADAREDGPAAYAGFMRLIEADVAEAQRFFKKSLAGRGATRRSAVEAMRAMVDSGVVGEEGLAEAFKYVVQKFRRAEPDALAEYMHSLGQTLLAAYRAGQLRDRGARLLTDVADATVHAANFRAQMNQPTSQILTDAEGLLVEASKVLHTGDDYFRVAQSLGRHSRVARHGKQVELAVYLLLRGMAMVTDIMHAQRTSLDVLWDFVVGSREQRVLAKHRALAEALATEQPGYAHYYLTLSYGYARDKREAVKHLGMLAQVDFHRYELAHEDPDMLEYVFDQVGTPKYFSKAPMRGKNPKGQ
jgi:hypothetical protein